jgi:DNA adenine methylase
MDKPILRYYGGKWRLAPWIISHFPDHRLFVEPFGGAASVLLTKERSYAEVYNDLDGDIVNLFRVLQNKNQFDELRDKLAYTPFSRAEYELAFEATREPVEQARRLLIRSWMGYGTGSATSYKSGYRTNVRSAANPAGDWLRLVSQIETFATRFMGVNIEQRPAGDVVSGHDSETTLFYCDPPYLLQTRNRATYRYEMSDSDHVTLAGQLRDCVGMVILSGYPCDLYDIDLYADWHRVEKVTQSEAHGRRTEVMWINDHAWDKLYSNDYQQLQLFGERS